jgi:alpha-tubulin suppressor-like RCC1 family protein
MKILSKKNMFLLNKIERNLQQFGINNPFLNKNIKNFKWIFDPFPEEDQEIKRDAAYYERINDKVLKSQVKKDYKTALYLWNSNISQKLRKTDLKAKFTLSNDPLRIEFFDDKNLKYVYSGPKHSGVVTEEGHLYMFGDNTYGCLGVGNIHDYGLYNPQLVDFFIDKDIKIKKVVCSRKNTMVLSEDGNIFTFGFGATKEKFFSIFRGTITHINLSRGGS